MRASLTDGPKSGPTGQKATKRADVAGFCRARPPKWAPRLAGAGAICLRRNHTGAHRGQWRPIVDLSQINAFN